MTTNESLDTNLQGNRATTKAATAAKDSIDAAGSTADKTINQVSSKLSDVSSAAIPALKQGVDRAKSWVDDQAGSVQDGIQAARDKASDVTGQISDYARDEPVKALLIAAAVGAGLMGLLSMMSRSRN